MTGKGNPAIFGELGGASVGVASPELVAVLLARAVAEAVVDSNNATPEQNAE